MAGERCPDGWAMVKLSDLGEVNRGRSRHRPRYAELLYGGLYPFIQTGDIKESGGRITTYKQTYSEAGLAQSRLWPAGTMCITIAANIAETGILAFPACFPDSVVGFVADDSRCDVYFIEYMFRFLKQRIQHEASGSVQDNINLATLGRLRFPIPPVPEQRAIAHILGTLDEKIELNRRMNVTLKAMTRALFKSWFVDFEPVRAKAEGQDTGLPEQISDLFPDHFQESELREVPEGWQPCTWGDLVTLEYGRGLRGYATEDGAYPVYGTNGRIGTHSDPLCHHPGIILGRKGAYRGVHFCNSPFFVIDTAFYIEPKVPLEMRWAFYEILRLDINGMDSGSAIPSTSRDDFYSLPVLLPPFEAQQSFVEILNPTWDRQRHNDGESHSLAAIRDVLLPKLLSGEIRVRDAERIVGENVS